MAKAKKPWSTSRVFLFCAVGLAPLYASSAMAQEWEVFTSISALAYSESFTISGIVDDPDNTDLNTTGEATLTSNEFAVGVRKGKWSLEGVARYDGFVDYTPDTAALVFASETESDFPNGSYDIEASIEQTQLYGARIGYRQSLTPNFDVTLRVSGLVSSEIIDGSLRGSLNLSDQEVDAATLELDYRFTRDLVFGREIDEVRGLGASLDAIIDWQVTDKLSLNLGAYDVLNRIWFDDLPGTEADITTAIRRLDDNGILIVRPRLSGRNLSGKYTQTLPLRLSNRVAYQIDDKWAVSQTLHKYNKTYLSETGIAMRLGQKSSIKTTYEWASGAVGLEVGYKGFKLGVASNNLDFEKARYLSLNASLAQKF